MKRKNPDSKSNLPDLKTREKDKFETIYILEKHELPSQRLKLVSDKTVANSEFRKKFGQLLYLENLKKSDYGKKGGTGNPEPCPVCQSELGHSWSVLQVIIINIHWLISNFWIISVVTASVWNVWGPWWMSIRIGAPVRAGGSTVPSAETAHSMERFLTSPQGRTIFNTLYK